MVGLPLTILSPSTMSRPSQPLLAFSFSRSVFWLHAREFDSLTPSAFSGKAGTVRLQHYLLALGTQPACPGNTTCLPSHADLHALATQPACPPMQTCLPWQHNLRALPCRPACPGNTTCLPCQHNLLALAIQPACPGNTTCLPWQHNLLALATQPACPANTTCLPWQHNLLALATQPACPHKHGACPGMLINIDQHFDEQRVPLTTGSGRPIFGTNFLTRGRRPENILSGPHRPCPR